jgi:hypothetical protein
MKYRWANRKFWKKWLRNDWKRFYYSKLYGFNMGGFNGTMIPETGKGKYVSTYRKGDIIQIKNESGYEHLEYDEIRIIPYKPNHGVMVERFKDGKLCDRHHLDIVQFNKTKMFSTNIEIDPIEEKRKLREKKLKRIKKKKKL